MPIVSNFELLKQVKQPVLAIRTKTTVAGIPVILGASFEKLGNYAKELDEILTDIPYVSYPGFEQMDENNVTVEIGLPVARSLPAKDDIESIFLPETIIAVCYYRGSYDAMELVYEEMMKWIKEQGYKMKGGTYEYYLNGYPFPEEEMLTKVVIPINR